MKPKRLNWAEISERLRRVQQLTVLADGGPAERARILEQRAQLLAAAADTGQAGGGGELIMVFRTGTDRFAVPVSALLEVLRQPKIAPVPGAPSEVVGLIQVRGDVRPVYDLPQLLGLERERPELRNVLLLETASGQFGIAVGEVEDVRAVAENQRRPAPGGRGHTGWMTDDLAAVLEVDSLVRKGE